MVTREKVGEEWVQEDYEYITLMNTEVYRIVESLHCTPETSNC